MSNPNSRLPRAPLPLPQRTLGPVADLEAHLPEEWWRRLFNALYIKTDGDVVENTENTRREVDFLLKAADVTPDSRILDLCCGQGRHSLELVRRGFRHVTGLDRSRYLVRLARKRAAAEGLSATFREGDARNPRLTADSFDCITILGNSFGYFSSQDDDAKVLRSAGKLLKPSGTLYLDLSDGDWIKIHYEPRSWEWIDGHHFVCRERSLSSDGNRLISREVIVHDELGVLADQFYAERLYTRETLTELLEACGYRDIRYHGQMESLSDRDQDLGMMARRMVLTALAPVKAKKTRKPRTTLNVTVLLGDPRLPDTVKRDGRFNEEDMETIRLLKEALTDIGRLDVTYLDNHATLERDLSDLSTDLVLNLCDEGFNNDPFKELHVPALLEMVGLPYTGAPPRCLANCYDKGLVRAVAAQLDVPVPLETYIRPGDQGATMPSVFPALLKPNFGDSSEGITRDAVVSNQQELLAYLDGLRALFPDNPVLVQEFLSGGEYSVGLIGNPDRGLRALPLLEVDYSGLDPALPQILCYESKWHPESPYWTRIRYREATLADQDQAMLIDHSMRLFERLGCRDYARFDFRADAAGTIKLLEVNPNPGWCWDGKQNLMAGFAGMSYAELLEAIIGAAEERLGLNGRRRPEKVGAARAKN
ncbi:methyltransferase domain-containing protein [Rhodobium gokarnense]|uniref:D-alanine--D-alanine ligase n=1 Tax=Rhodobium gokarnense TaxID=364296 RepID=A0ABT3H7J5_9HYPH|nr:methyltransferase domain-containing protein [Rhodobium gokarnense]MCW2306363.1 D-alanine-D-alanine ligase [Rhodobium gokarnense]